MSKKRKKNKKQKKESFIELLGTVRNEVHYAHLTSNVNAGVMGKQGRAKTKSDRKKAKKDCRELERK